ncbi:MAG: hypothetical protein VCC68_09880 [Myxococcota bacterium]
MTTRSNRRICAGALALALALVAFSAQAGSRRYDWLAGTTWYVPSSGITALYWSSEIEEAVPAIDQTVYIIDQYADGYFSGRATTLLNGSTRACRWLIGSVTPRGEVLLSFIPLTGDDAATTLGFGKMRRRRGRWSMINQTVAALAGGQLAHWAKMKTILPTDADYLRLPGTDESLPDFIAACWPD